MENSLLSIRSATDRFPQRKFQVSMESIKDKFGELYDYNSDSVYLLDKVMKCYNLNVTYGSNKFNRYSGELRKDVYYLPTMLGLNESIKECHQKWLAVYDLSKLHTVALGALLGESPSRVTSVLENYLALKGISFSKYLNYVINGIQSDILDLGFNLFELLNLMSNSYLNLEKIADSRNLSVLELIRLYLIKFNSVAFEDFMGYMESLERGILVQSVGLDTLVISAQKESAFEDLSFISYKNRYYLKPEIFEINEFNKLVPMYYLNRKLVGTC